MGSNTSKTVFCIKTNAVLERVNPVSQEIKDSSKEMKTDSADLRFLWQVLSPLPKANTGMVGERTLTLISFLKSIQNPIGR